MNKFIVWIKRHHILAIASCLGMLGAAIGLVIYYIAGPSTAFFHSDCTDSLLWAQISIETGKVFSKDFYYAALLPFGANLWMMPILRIFGYTMAAQKISMAVFAVIFVFSSFSLFRAMKWKCTASAGGALTISLLLCGSVKLREIMWEHVIYYSLGILFFMLLLNLCLRLGYYIKRFISGESGCGFYLKFGLLATALLLLSIGCATDGAQVLIISVLPILGGLLAVLYFDEKSCLRSRDMLLKYIPIGIMVIGTTLGIVILYALTDQGEIASQYVAESTNWKDISLWWGNIETLLTNYLTLFGISIKADSSLFSVSSVFVLIMLLAALITFICPLLLLLRYKRLKTDAARLVAWSNCFLTAVIIFGHICGQLSDANWRLTPMLGCAIIATAVYLHELFLHKGFERRMACVLAAALIITAAFNAYSVIRLPNTAGNNRKYIEIAETLADDGHTKGYATFWNAGNTTLLSDGKVKVITIEANRDGLQKRQYQTSDYWFKSEPDRNSYFLILTKDEYVMINQSDYWKELTVPDNLIDNWECEGLYVFVFAENPIK